jgi:hypothetical protein
VHAAKYVPEKSSIFPFVGSCVGVFGVELDEAIVCYLGSVTLSQGRDTKVEEVERRNSAIESGEEREKVN